MKQLIDIIYKNLFSANSDKVYIIIRHEDNGSKNKNNDYVLIKDVAENETIIFIKKGLWQYRFLDIHLTNKRLPNAERFINEIITHYTAKNKINK